MPEQHDRALVVNADEEAYLRGAFRRFAAPYLVSMIVLVAALWIFGSTRSPTAVPVQDADVASLRAELEALSEKVEHAVLEAQQATELARSVPAPEAGRGTSPSDSPEWKALKKRLDHVGTKIKQLEARPPERIERVVAQAGAAPADDVTKSLLERMYNIELRQEKEEKKFRGVQKSLQDRVQAIEARGSDAVAKSTTLEQSVLARLQNIENRFDNIERSQPGSLPSSPR